MRQQILGREDVRDDKLIADRRLPIADLKTPTLRGISQPLPSPVPFDLKFRVKIEFTKKNNL